MKESEILKKCLQFLALHGVFCWRQNQGAVSGEYKGQRRFVRFASIAGISDIIGLIPPDGRLLAVETKAAKGMLSPAQGIFLDQVRGSGGLALVVRSVSDLEKALVAEGII